MKIIKIEKMQPELTVDIEVSGTHTYQLDNGCVSHNTVGELVGASSGIHARFSQYYVRTVRNDKLDPIGQFMQAQGVPCEDDLMKPDKTMIFSFPMKSPETSVFASELGAIEQLEHYLSWYKHWAEHTVSITVYVKEHEWLDVGAWVYKHFDDVGGISFLPYSEHSYKQAPFQAIDKDEYEKLLAEMPKIKWDEFNVVEHTDSTTASQNLACVGGVCEII